MSAAALARFDRRAFEQRFDERLELPSEAIQLAYSLRTAPQTIQLELQLPATRLLFVKLKESNDYHIDRFLLYGKDFVFDDKKKRAVIQIELPACYLLTGQFLCQIEFAYFNDAYEVQKRELETHFYWSVLKAVGQDPQPTNFTTLSDLVFANRVPEKTLTNLRLELQKSHPERWSPRLQKCVRKLGGPF